MGNEDAMREAALHRGVLGIEGTTSEDDIRRRYRELIKRYHPDRAPRGRESEFLRRAQALNAAREWMLSHRGAWAIEAPAAPVAQPSVMRNDIHHARTATYAPPVYEVPIYTRGKPSEVASSPRRSGMSWVGWVLAIYLGLLAFAVIGWLLTTLIAVLPGILAIL